jgi:NAD(P)-dependent dehydrogenase (short-subunit alcohol dehydrogenase family)
VSADERLVLGRDGGLAHRLAEALGGELRLLPRAADDASWARWRAELAAGPRYRQIVVAMGSEPPAPPRGLAELEPDVWQQRAEEPFLAWCVALGAAAVCCADAGAIVAVAETPAPLDAAGFAAESGLADAVSALIRSIAQSEGGRGVRANAVTTPARLGPGAPDDGRGDPAAPAPPLARFPGRLVPEVVGAVRLLLGDEACGITGRTLPADCGRSW